MWCGVKLWDRWAFERNKNTKVSPEFFHKVMQSPAKRGKTFETFQIETWKNKEQQQAFLADLPRQKGKC